MIRVTRRYNFSASHRLHSPRLTERQNREIYGKCNNPHGHGHNYVLEVSVRGPVDPLSGLAVDVAALDRLVQTQILPHFHLRDMNRDVPEFEGLVPTSENLALVVKERLERAWAQEFRGAWPVLEKVRIQETPRNIFEVFVPVESRTVQDQTAGREFVSKS